MLDASVLAQPASLVRESSALYGDMNEAVDADTFRSLWPRLAAFLATPRTEMEIAESFDLEADQTKEWLQRALDEGLVRKLSNPIRFERINSAGDSQGSLFES
jgi:hypothetical protein